jgi:hypothetical protein
MATAAEHSRLHRARQRDDEIVRFSISTLAAPSVIAYN